MNRTRGIFLAALVLTLGIIVVSLVLEIISQTTALQLFIATTVFSVGVVLLDFLGILGGHHDVDSGDMVTAGHFGDDASGDGGDLGGHFDVDASVGQFDAGDSGGDFDAQGGDDAFDGGHFGEAAEAGHGGETGDAQHDLEGMEGEGAGQTHVSPHAASAPILSVLGYLRLMVYFCLGFGPTGWVAMATGRSALVSMVYAVPVGLASMFVARAFFRFQRRDTDSQIRAGELVSMPAVVIIPLNHETMGKVRIQIGMNVTEQYALAATPDRHFEKGDQVRISRVTEECVYVK